MAYADDIARAVWEYPTRSLINGVATTPTTPEADIARAVWTYASRKFTTVDSLDVVADGVPFVKLDLTNSADKLDVVADGVPFVAEPANVSVISDTGGLWSSSSTWVDGIVPSSTSHVVATPTSGNLVVDIDVTCLSLDLSQYTGTLSNPPMGGGNHITITGVPGNTNNVIFSSAMTSTWAGTLTLGSTGATINLTNNGKLTGAIRLCIDGIVNFLDNLTTTGAILLFGDSTLGVAAGKTISAAYINTATSIASHPVTLRSLTSGSAATITATNASSLFYCTIQDITKSGGSTITAYFSTDVSGNTGVTFFTAYKVISDAGGNWNATTTWVDGVVPAANSIIKATPTSGNLVVNTSTNAIRAIDLTGYNGVLSGTGALLITAPIYGETICDLSLVSSATVDFSIYFITSYVNHINFKATNVTFNSVYGIDVNYGYGNRIGFYLYSDLIMASNSTFTAYLTNIYTNNYDMTLGTLSSTNGYRGLYFGTSTITAAKMDFSDGGDVIFDIAESTLICTGDFILGNQALPLTVKNLSIIGTGNTVWLGADVTVSDTLTLGSAATTVFKNTYLYGGGTLRSTGTNIIQNVNFRNITANGTANWDLTGTNCGDCGGNSGIIFDNSVTQTWNGTTGNWSELALWTSRVPLPQDDVILPNPGGTGRSITADIVNLGKNITVTNTSATNKFTLNINVLDVNICGSLTLVSSTYMTFNNTYAIIFAGGANATLDMAGFSPADITVADYCTLTLASALTTSGRLTVNSYGAFDCNEYNVTVGTFYAYSLSAIYRKSAIWTVTGTSFTNYTTDNIGVNDTLVFSYASSFASTLAMGTSTYNNIKITSGGTGVVTFSGAFTFKNMSRASAGTKTVKFKYNTTYTHTGNDFFRPYTTADVSTWTITSTTTGQIATINKTSGHISTNRIALTDIVASGGGEFFAGSNSTKSASSAGWVLENARTISDAGGNWSATTTWVEGVVPIAGDDIRATATSGDLVVNTNTASLNSIDLTGYTGALSGTGLIYIKGTTGSNVLCKLISNTLVTIGGLRLTPVATGVTISLYTSGIVFGGDVTLNGYSETTVNLLSDLTLTSAYTVLMYPGVTLNTNNHNIYAGAIRHSGTGSRILNLGTSILTGTVDITLNATNTVWDADEATLRSNFSVNYGTCTSIKEIGFLSSNTTCTITGNNGCAVDTLNMTQASNNNSYVLSLGQPLTVTNLTLVGYNPARRLLVKGSAFGYSRPLICNGTLTAANVDFQDISASGSVSWDLSAITGGSGDCGGNSGITFTPAITKYWTGSTMNWSNLAAWTDNIIPLPQDSVILPDPGGTGRTLTADMPRLCKNITVTNNNATNEFTVYFGMAVNFYGSITLTPHVNITQISPWTADWTLSGRSYHSIDMAGKSVPRGLIIAAPGGTYTAQSAVSIPVSLLFVNGNYNNGGYTTTASTGVGASTGTSKILSGAGSYVCRSLDMWAADLTWSYPSDLYLTGGIDTVNNMPGLTVGNIIVSLDTKTTTFKGAFTFANMTMASAGAKTIKFTKATTYTMTGDNFLSGTANNLITIDTNDGTGTWTLNKTAGTIATDYISLKNSTATGGATFYAGSHSVDVSGNTGWIFSDPNTNASISLDLAHAIADLLTLSATGSVIVTSIVATSQAEEIISGMSGSASVTGIASSANAAALPDSVSASAMIQAIIASVVAESLLGDVYASALVAAVIGQAYAQSYGIEFAANGSVTDVIAVADIAMLASLVAGAADIPVSEIVSSANALASLVAGSATTPAIEMITVAGVTAPSVSTVSLLYGLLSAHPRFRLGTAISVLNASIFSVTADAVAVAPFMYNMTGTASIFGAMARANSAVLQPTIAGAASVLNVVAESIAEVLSLEASGSVWARVPIIESTADAQALAVELICDSTLMTACAQATARMSSDTSFKASAQVASEIAESIAESLPPSFRAIAIGILRRRINKLLGPGIEPR